MTAGVKSALQRGGEALYRLADAVQIAVFPSEQHDRPDPIAINGRTIDTLDDLTAYTRLPRATVERLVLRRRPMNFRSEWSATPPRIRTDGWYYLSSKGYLFANATHFGEPAAIDFAREHVPAGGTVLDFGAGTGEFGLRLAAAGYRVVLSELNALQRDFARFRIHRHQLHVEVIDPWQPIAPHTFDAIVALDVIEHLDDASTVLGEQLLPALKPSGALIEQSPFEADAANPMHHEDFGLDRFMAERGYAVSGSRDGARAWRRT